MTDEVDAKVSQDITASTSSRSTTAPLLKTSRDEPVGDAATETTGDTALETARPTSEVLKPRSRAWRAMLPTRPTAADSGRWWYVAAGGALAVVMLLGVSNGSSGPAAWRVPLALLDHLPWITIDSELSEIEWNIIWQVRVPRVLLGALVGGMLSIGGAGYQGVFRNPLVDPYLLGAAAGAGLGATLVFTVARGLLTGWPIDMIPVVAFAGAILAVTVTYTVGGAFGSAGRSGATLVLAGVAVSAFFTAIQSFLLQRNVDVVQDVYSWIIGRLSAARWADVRLCAPYIAVSVVVLLAFRRRLDVFRIGDAEAGALGMSVERTRFVVVGAATLGTAAAVGVSGLIGFVGLVVPHVVRLVAGSSYRHLMPLSLLFGATFLILADIPGRSLQGGAETPIGVVTAFLGAPFFVYLLRVSHRSGSMGSL